MAAGIGSDMARRPKGVSFKEWMNAPCEGCGRKRAQCECLELALLQHIRFSGLPEPIREFPFAHPRRWRADFAWPDYKLLVEVEGGGRVGRHQNQGFDADAEKYNAASRLGWTLLRFSGKKVKDGIDGRLAVDEITLALEERGWRG